MRGAAQDGVYLIDGASFEKRVCALVPGDLVDLTVSEAPANPPSARSKPL
jgi:hypothetical protein